MGTSCAVYAAVANICCLFSFYDGACLFSMGLFWANVPLGVLLAAARHLALASRCCAEIGDILFSAHFRAVSTSISFAYCVAYFFCCDLAGAVSCHHVRVCRPLRPTPRIHASIDVISQCPARYFVPAMIRLSLSPFYFFALVLKGLPFAPASILFVIFAISICVFAPVFIA